MTGPDPYSVRALWRHYRACRRNKRNTKNALAFEVDAEASLLALQSELRAHTYRPRRSICFITQGPKPREVFAADFRDRVVHHLLVALQEPVFERLFIHDSYACRKGKGTLAASDRLMDFLRRATANGRRPAWAVHLDVASFFPSIHKETLFAILAARTPGPELQWLTRTVLFHDPTTSYSFQSRDRRAPGPGNAGYPVPSRKSLFGKGNERGLPIGNLTSQFWANVYMNELDQFVKREVGCRYYIRYVDDLVLLANDPGALVAARGRIQEFLRERLGLELRADGGEVQPVARGIDFVGWKTWWDRRLPRRRTLRNLEDRLGAFARAAVRSSTVGPGLRIDLHDDESLVRVERLRAVLASYSGHLRHGNAWGNWAGAWSRRPWLSALFERRGWRIEERWPQRRLAPSRSFRDQYRRLVRRAGERCLVFCQVGRFVEFRGPQRVPAQRALGLRTAHLARAGYALSVGFPMRLRHRYEARALGSGFAVALVPEMGRLWSGRLARRTVRVLVPGLASFDVNGIC